jgi:hypothetical protein
VAVVAFMVGNWDEGYPMFGAIWRRPFRYGDLDADEQLYISELPAEEREYWRKLFRERDERRRHPPALSCLPPLAVEALAGTAADRFGV